MIVSHLAVPWLLRRSGDRAVFAASLALSLWPDLDVVGWAFGAPVSSPWSHGGLTHSLLVAGVLALVAWKLLGRGAAMLFTCALSHPLLDALISNGPGVMLLSPLTTSRVVLLHLVPAPLGLDEAFGPWGLASLLDEALFVLTPLVLFARLRADRRVLAGLAAWVVVCVAVRQQLPLLTGGRAPRVMQLDDELDELRAAMPDASLVTKWSELVDAGLVNQPLEQVPAPWSSGYFPSLYGGEAGDWRASPLTLLWRTATGVPVPTRADAVRWWAASAGDRFGLPPTVKYDLAAGDDAFSATALTLSRTHNRRPWPRYWFGVCNGVAAAGLARPEPRYAVDVPSPDGGLVRFHPVDVKALLGDAYYWTRGTRVLGGVCDDASFDPGASCSMNPASLALALTNLMGLAHRGLLVDVHPSRRSQNHPVGRATLRALAPPRAVTDAGVAFEVDVEFVLELGSTTAPPSLGDHLEDADAGRYQAVGFLSEPFSYRGALGLDAEGSVVAGRWVDDGPDYLTLPGEAPVLTDAGTLEGNPWLSWAFIDRLARASASDGQW